MSTGKVLYLSEGQLADQQDSMGQLSTACEHAPHYVPVSYSSYCLALGGHRGLSFLHRIPTTQPSSASSNLNFKFSWCPRPWSP